jgi:hypothetical protein
MKLLSEKVGFVDKKNFCTLNLPKVEALCFGLISCRHDWVAERSDMIAEFKSVINDLGKYSLLVGLEWKGLDIILPGLEILYLRASCISRNSDTPVTDWTSIFLIILDFATSNLETFAVIPRNA